MYTMNNRASPSYNFLKSESRFHPSLDLHGHALVVVPRGLQPPHSNPVAFPADQESQQKAQGAGDRQSSKLHGARAEVGVVRAGLVS